MKKTFIAVLLLMMILISSCGNSAEETTAEATTEEATTEAAPSLNEMSPLSMDVTLPERFKVRLSDIDFDSMTEIEAEDSVFPETAHDKILQGDKVQFFFLSGDNKVHAVFFDENDRVNFSASYNSDTGFAEFFGDAQNSWYFDDTGELRCFVYTYDFDGTSDAPIYTFYSPDGKKDVARTLNGWYSAEYDLLTNEEVMDCLKKYQGVIEATEEYKNSDITGLN